MAVQVAEKIKVYIETPGGTISEITGYVQSISVTCGYGPTRTDISILGHSIITDRNEITARRQAPEWKCDHCGRVNKMERTTCDGCGAGRSFIYGP